ncbi:MAG: type II toxin-antitoxin system VapC family toxin [Candidatus Symbiothrix sp.]|jgi:predicted nucleic acid-binding protein|nr:type II toxin-antitoxin system VapC family toxin [Candidatus Symbiothrix sp.]
MGTKYLLDSNIIIGYLDSKLPPKGMDFVSAIVDKVPNISVISQIEVLRYNAPSEIIKILSEFVNSSVIMPLDSSIVEVTIDLCRQSKIKLPDAIIAATALVHKLTLLTRNIVDFKNIEGLKLIDPHTL